MADTAGGRRPMADREFGDYVAAREPAMLRFARLLCGDPDRAADLTEHALAAAYRRWGRVRASADTFVRAAMLRALLLRRGTPPAPGGALGGLSARARAVLVLRELEGLSYPQIGELLHLSPRTAHAAHLEARAAVAQCAPGVPLEEALLGDADEEQPADRINSLPAVYDRARRQRRARRRRTAAVVGVAVLLAGLWAGVRAVRHADDPLSVPVAQGLLDWPTRGALAGDDGFVRSAVDVWKGSAVRAGGAPPASDVRALYAGRLGAGRFAVLEGLDAARRPWVAVVAEHGPDGSVQLTLDSVGRLPARPPPVLVFGYDGNLNVPWLQPAPPAAYYQALVSPRVTRLQQRVLDLRQPDPYPTGFRTMELTDGLTRSWLSVPTGSRGSMRAFRGSSLVFEGVVPLAGPVPTPVRVTVATAPLPATGDAVSEEQQHDDGLLFAERLGGCPVTVSTLWAGLLPNAVPARLLAARCGGHYATGLAVGRGGRSELVDLRQQPLDLRGIDVVASRTTTSNGDATTYVVVVARSPDTRLLLLAAGRPPAESRTGVLVAACSCVAPELRAYDGAGRRLAVGGGVT